MSLSRYTSALEFPQAEGPAPYTLGYRIFERGQLGLKFVEGSVLFSFFLLI